jgi:UDPglucose 6-dehydrogenase
MPQNKKIIVVGAGHVGLAYGTLLAKKYDVTMVDIDEDKVASINQGNIKATTDKTCYKDAEFILIAVPTNYDERLKGLDCSIITSVLTDIKQCGTSALVVIKSTVYIGYTAQVCKDLDMHNVIFSPEFLREDTAVYDIQVPSRIVVGCDDATRPQAEEYAKIMTSISYRKDVPIYFTSNSEAEAIKLFSNAYLATRIAFFNELDSYALASGMNSRTIIEGVCADSRIGDHYNNPSFGYGGYCLPKDTRQLSTLMKDSRYSNVGSVISGTVTSNETRAEICVEELRNRLNSKGILLEDAVIGIYKLNGLHNSIMREIIFLLQRSTSNILIYEPRLECSKYDGCEVTDQLSAFKEKCTIILADRIDMALNGVADKIFTRDQTKMRIPHDE